MVKACCVMGQYRSFVWCWGRGDLKCDGLKGMRGFDEGFLHNGVAGG